MTETLNEDAARDLRLRLRALEDRIEDLEVGVIRTVADAVSILELLKSRPGGWVTNEELRTAVGNGYNSARGALMVLGLVETKRVAAGGEDGRGIDRILTRHTEGGVHGRISRRRILEAATMGTDTGRLE